MSKESDYVEAVDNYLRLLDKYFSIMRVINGKSLIAGESLTSLARKELREAYNRVTEARKEMGF